MAKVNGGNSGKDGAILIEPEEFGGNGGVGILIGLACPEIPADSARDSHWI